MGGSRKWKGERGAKRFYEGQGHFFFRKSGRNCWASIIANVVAAVATTAAAEGAG
jgi:hypothetical protein